MSGPHRVSVETGVYSRRGARRLNSGGGSPFCTDARGSSETRAHLARITRDPFGGRPYEAPPTPKPWPVTFPGKVSAHPSRRPQALSAASEPPPFRCGPRCCLPAERASQARTEAQSRLGPSPTAPVQLPSPPTLSYTRYRTRPFDNLRPSCKFRAYWGFEKSRNNEDTEDGGI